MSTQYDFVAGYDPSADVQITAAQLLQMVNQLSPLSNVGGVIVMSGASSAHPDVTNNPRFVRYCWIDTQTAGSPVLKVYVGSGGSDTYADWSALVIANDSITAAKLADYAVTVLNSDGDKKIAYNQDASADSTKANFVLRLDGNGQYVEVANLTTLIQATTINVNKLIAAAASNGQVLQYNGTTNVFEPVTLSVGGLISDNSITPQKLTNGTASYLLRAGSAGVAEYVSNNDTVGGFLPNNSIIPARLYSAVPTAGNKLRHNGTNWVEYTPCFKAPTSGGATVPAADGVQSVAHGLSSTPTNVKLILVANATDNGYASGDRVDGSYVWGNNGGSFRVPVSVYADATYVYASWDNPSTSYQIVPKSGGNSAAIDPTKWNVYLYADI